jgi:hypothetical protein
VSSSRLARLSWFAGAAGVALASACGAEYSAASVPAEPGRSTDAGDASDASIVLTPDASRPPADAGNDAPVARCDPSKAYGAPALVSSLSTPGIDMGARLAVNETLVFFTHADVPPAHTFVALRASASGDFGATAQDPILNTASSDTYNVSPTRDGLTVYFQSNRDDPGTGKLRLFVATRATLQSTFTTVTKITTVPDDLDQPYLVPNGSALYYTSGSKIVRSAIVSGAIGAAVDVGLPSGIITPVVSSDELTVFYAQANGANKHDVFQATRSSTSSTAWTLTPVTSVDTADEEYPTWVSDDGCELWFQSDRTTGGRTNKGDIYLATKPL